MNYLNDRLIDNNGVAPIHRNSFHFYLQQGLTVQPEMWKVVLCVARTIIY